MSEELENPVLPESVKLKRSKSMRRAAAVIESEIAQSNGVTPQEEREARLDIADREAIDNIVLSSDVGKGGKIRITRKGPLDHTYQYVTTVPADAWNTESSFEFVKKTYGGGDYKCQTFRANGQLYKPFEFSIDYRIKGSLDEDEIKRLALEQQGQMSRTTTSDMFKMFDMLRDNKPQDTGFKSGDMIKLMEMNSQKSDQMMVMMMTMMNESSKNMMGMMQVMMAGQANKGSGIDPVILQLLTAKSEKTPILEVLETMKAIKELTSNEKQPEEEKPFWERLAMAAAPALLGGLTGAGAGAGAPAAAPTAPAGQLENQTPTEEMLNNYLVRMFLGKILTAATENRDPALYADMISETLSPAQLDMLKNVLTQADWAVKLFGQDQRVASCIEWLTELKQLILTDASSEPTTESAGKSGDPVQPKP